MNMGANQSPMEVQVILQILVIFPYLIGEWWAIGFGVVFFFFSAILILTHLLPKIFQRFLYEIRCQISPRKIETERSSVNKID